MSTIEVLVFVENYLEGKSLQFSWTRNDVEEKRKQIALSLPAFSCRQGSMVTGVRQFRIVIPTQETLSVKSVSDRSLGQSDSGSIEPKQSTSGEASIISITSIQKSAKRMRDESPGDDAGVKRSKEKVAEASPADVPDITITDESSQPDHRQIQWAEVAPVQQVEVEPKEGAQDTYISQEAPHMETATKHIPSSLYYPLTTLNVERQNEDHHKATSRKPFRQTACLKCLVLIVWFIL
ncbi:hypothetical protein DPMN_140880 [Dreissena polymorpha]|uniref:Uncharacterized protein n=2 Tax=Dreissena polymorpha TaxID=45954 RepID=A0A9D4JKS1_DREPO|nr:hypothetical protein DPMN_140880 [Dreissena polymorpha]